MLLSKKILILLLALYNASVVAMIERIVQERRSELLKIVMELDKKMSEQALDQLSSQDERTFRGKVSLFLPEINEIGNPLEIRQLNGSEAITHLGKKIKFIKRLISEEERAPESELDISGIDKKTIIKALYGNAYCNMNNQAILRNQLTEAQILQALQNSSRIGTINGQLLMIDLSKNTLDPSLYNMLYGRDAAQITLAQLSIFQKILSVDENLTKKENLRELPFYPEK